MPRANPLWRDPRATSRHFKAQAERIESCGIISVFLPSFQNQPTHHGSHDSKTSPHLYLHSQRGYPQIPFPNCTQKSIPINQSKIYIIPLYRIAGYGEGPISYSLYHYLYHSLFHIPAIPYSYSISLYTRSIPAIYLSNSCSSYTSYPHSYSHSIYQLSYSTPLHL